MAAAGAVHMTTLNLKNGDYAQVIGNLRDVLADHESPEEVAGHPVLGEQKHPGVPKRWMHIKLVAGSKETTLAVRDDNVYLIGFQSKNGRWYELGFQGETKRIIPGSTFLGCDVTYSKLLEVNSGCQEQKNRRVREQIVSLKLGRTSAIDAVGILSVYNQGEGVAVDTVTRRALVHLILMFCEATRMIPFFNTVVASWDNEEPTEGHIQMVDSVYIWNWGIMSGALLDWRETEPNYTRCTRCRSSASQKEKGEKQEGKAKEDTNNDGNGDDTGAGDDNGGHEKKGNGKLLPQGSGTDAQTKRSGFGRPLVQVFGVRADLHVVGTIAVFDGKRGQIIYKNHASISNDPSQSESMIDLALTGPYRGISADGSFAVQVDGIPTTGASDESKNVAGEMLWDCYSDNVVYNMVLTHGIPRFPTATGTTTNIAEVTYAVLSNAVEATVQVELKLKGDKESTTACVHGEITAHYEHYKDHSILLFSSTEDKEMELKVPACGGFISIPIPLRRSVIAAPVGSSLQINVKIHVTCPPNHKNTIFFDDDLVFPLVDQQTGKLTEDDVAVQVKIKSSDIYTQPGQNDTTLPTTPDIHALPEQCDTAQLALATTSDPRSKVLSKNDKFVIKEIARTPTRGMGKHKAITTAPDSPAMRTRSKKKRKL
ncbi:hypothetical protein CFC21_045029 [Triticum aestivum]|uniref:rRNA N-glycosidase n=4 Tax=Triticum TaxID=4564 RepID=A0A3B6FZ56_WHEAT|nr:hypothetical protein CFC21_045029 [Triticum aestivum]